MIFILKNPFRPVISEEEYRDITEDMIPNCLPYYQISNYGNFRNKFYRGKKRFFYPKLTPANTGYILVSISLKNGNHRLCSVHRLVMMAFWPIPNMNQLQIDHIDGNKINNNLNNLQWVDGQENVKRAINTGLFKIGENSCHTNLTEETIRKVCSLLEQYPNIKGNEIVNLVGNGITVSKINDIRNSKSWLSISKDYNIHPTHPRYMFDENTIENICKAISISPKPNNISNNEYGRIIARKVGISDEDKNTFGIVRIFNKQQYRDISDKYF